MLNFVAIIYIHLSLYIFHLSYRTSLKYYNTVIIRPGTVGPSRPGLETDCNQNILF